MKTPTRTPKELRQILIEYLDFLIAKKHIACRQTLAKYRFRLVLDELLTTKELNVIIKFLVRDSGMTKPELKQMFQPLVLTKSNKQPSEDAASLRQFFR